MRKLVKIDKGKVGKRRYAQEFKDEALALGARVGIAEAAKQLGLHESQLYAWRSQARSKEQRSEAEQRLSVEVARLKRLLADQAEELAIIKKAAAYFAKSLK